MQDRKNELQKTLASIIKNYRKTSITKLSDEIGISKSILSDLENGNRDIKLSTLWKIAEGLEILPSVILHDVEMKLGKNFSFLENTPADIE